MGQNTPLAQKDCSKTAEGRNTMSEQGNATVLEQATERNHTAPQPAANRQQPTVISDPREIAAIIMTRMHLINAKKDDLTIAIKSVTDLTQQLTQVYAGQMQIIEQLAARLKALEEKAGTNGVNGHAAAPAMSGA
jgi:hypothetical protein